MQSTRFQSNTIVIYLPIHYINLTLPSVASYTPNHSSLCLSRLYWYGQGGLDKKTFHHKLKPREAEKKRSYIPKRRFVVSYPLGRAYTPISYSRAF